MPSCLTWCFASDVDSYKVEFGGVQSPQYRALLMALAIFIDFRQNALFVAAHLHFTRF